MLERLANLGPEKLTNHLDALNDLFEIMDCAYEQIAERYGFGCTGCEDNCCLTLFYHHTVLEYLLLKTGFQALDPTERDAIHQKALQVHVVQTRAERTGKPVTAMCPLNQAGLCRLYHQRPMICRLHGIPNELGKPGQVPVTGPGCGEFEKNYGKMAVVRLDRTPFYMQLAHLERRLRGAYGLQEKLKMTVAHMITTF